MSYTIGGRVFETWLTEEDRQFIHEETGSYYEDAACECCSHPWGEHISVRCGAGTCGNGPGSKLKVPILNPTKSFILR